MPIDREATLKNAEKFLRVGRLDAAIAEYARLVEDQPRDWNTTNALGDLYVRVNQPEKAVGLYRRIAEHLLAEGFSSKAAAVFKKLLKLAPDDEGATLHLAEISAEQGLMADAKAYFGQITNRRRQRGDEAGADEITIRLGSLDPEDGDAALAAARAAERTGKTGEAAQRYRDLHDLFLAQGREADALAALRDSARCSPGSPDAAVLLPLAASDLREGRVSDGRARLRQLIEADPANRTSMIDLAWTLVPTHPAAAGVCVDVIADAIAAGGAFDEAAAVLQAFTARVPDDVSLLLRLVEVCVDGGLEAAMYDAQARLADAYLLRNRAAEARVIAEDLVSRDPGDAAHVARLRRALEALNVPDIERVIAECMRAVQTDPDEGGDDFPWPEPRRPVARAHHAAPVERPDALPVPPAPRAPVLTPAPEREPASDIPHPLPAPGAGSAEIDLTSLLGELEGAVAAPVPSAQGPGAPARDLEEVFDRLRNDAGEHRAVDDPAEYFELARTYLEMNMPDEAVTPLELAARSPQHRFAAAALLAQLHRDRSDLVQAIEWFERAAEAPAPGPDEAHALLYDLGDVLETVGETARALAVFMELGADDPDYRDVAARVMRLSRTEMEG